MPLWGFLEIFFRYFDNLLFPLANLRVSAVSAEFKIAGIGRSGPVPALEMWKSECSALEAQRFCSNSKFLALEITFQDWKPFLIVLFILTFRSVLWFFLLFFGLATCGPCMTLSKWLSFGTSKWQKWRRPKPTLGKDTRIEVPTAANFRMLSNHCHVYNYRIPHLRFGNVLVITHTLAVPISFCDWMTASRSSIQSLQNSKLRNCCQVSAEGWAVLFGCNEFVSSCYLQS